MAGSIRQRGKQSWEVRAFVGKDPATGKKQYVTKTIRGERREAEVALGRMLGEIEDGQYAVRAGTVGDLCEKWFAQAEPDLSPSVGPEYRRLLDNRILPRWGNVPLRRLRTADLDLWYAELRRKGALNGGPLAPNSVMRIHSVLRRALGQGVKWGWISMNPAANASPPRARKQQLNLPDPADVGRLIEAASKINSSLPTYFRLAAATGARRGEMCALRWKHVDFERRRLTIARGIVEAGGELIEKDTKTHQVRSVSLDEETAAILLAHRDSCAALAAECGAVLLPDSFLFSHEVDFSKPWRPGYATLAFGRLRDELGLTGVKLHHLRHFSATQLLSLGIDIRTVSGRLGHANASTTLDIYAQFVEQADERAADVLGVLLAQKGDVRPSGSGVERLRGPSNVRRRSQMVDGSASHERPHLLSIGHSNVSIETFVGLLKSHDVEVVADVRTAPRSSYVPHFDQKPLREALAATGIKYAFLGRELGGRPDGDEFYDDDDRVLYGRLAESALFGAGLERLLDGAEKFRVAMLCSEEDPLNCHRHLLVGRVLRSRGVEVAHIRGDGTVQTEEALDRLERRDDPQRPLFDTPAEEQQWRSTRSVSRRRAQLTSSDS